MERAAAEDAEELRAAVELSLALEAESSLAGARARVDAAPPPPLGTPGAVTVRVALPTGSKLERRFPAGATVALLADFVVVASADLGEPLPQEAFDLGMQVPPRTVFATHDGASPDRALTLVAAGLNGATVLVKKR